MDTQAWKAWKEAWNWTIIKVSKLMLWTETHFWPSCKIFGVCTAASSYNNQVFLVLDPTTALTAWVLWCGGAGNTTPTSGPPSWTSATESWACPRLTSARGSSETPSPLHPRDKASTRISWRDTWQTKRRGHSQRPTLQEGTIRLSQIGGRDTQTTVSQMLRILKTDPSVSECNGVSFFRPFGSFLT